MGNSSVKRIVNHYQSNRQWISIGSGCGYLKVVDPNKDIKGEKYIINLPIVESNMQSILFRKHPCQHIVGIHSINLDGADKMCFSPNSATIVIQQVPYRLPDIGAISFDEGLYIMECILKGQLKLQQNYLPFYQITENHVCFTTEGISKFWINQKYERSQADCDQTFNQADIVKLTFAMIQSRIIHSSALQDYLEIKNTYKLSTIKRAVIFLNKFKGNQYIKRISRLARINYLDYEKLKKNDVHNANISKHTKKSLKKSIDRNNQQKAQLQDFSSPNNKHKISPTKFSMKEYKITHTSSKTTRENDQILEKSQLTPIVEMPNTRCQEDCKNFGNAIDRKPLLMKLYFNYRLDLMKSF